MLGSSSHFKMILRKPKSLMKPTRNEMEHAVDLSVHNMSLPFDRACRPDRIGNVFAFSCVRKPQPKATIGDVFSLSSSPNGSIRCSPPTPRPPTQAAHQLLFMFLFLSARLLPKVPRLLRFPFSTSARDSPTGSISSPIGTTSRFRVFVGLTSALFCHPQDNDQHRSHCWSLLISLR